MDRSVPRLRSTSAGIGTLPYLMLTPYFIHITGLVALAINVSGLIRPSDKALRARAGWASALWALNNLFMGAHGAAALNVLSAGRQASANVLVDKARHIKLAAFLTFEGLCLLTAWITWSGPVTVFTTAGSMLATFAMFYLGGMWLRATMAFTSVLWCYNAIVYDSWYQLIANLIAFGAAGYGAWKVRKLPIVS